MSRRPGPQTSQEASCQLLSSTLPAHPSARQPDKGREGGKVSEFVTLSTDCYKQVASLHSDHYREVPACGTSLLTHYRFLDGPVGEFLCITQVSEVVDIAE